MKHLFKRLTPNVWTIDSQNERLKAALHRKISFQGIISLLRQDAKVISIMRNRKRKSKTIFRPKITIAVNRRALNLFHNSCSGYRAQYYHSVPAGEAANKCTLSRLLPLIKRYLRQNPKSTCPYDWVMRTLTDDGAKVWIYQGKWIRHIKSSHKMLKPRRWKREAEKTPIKKRPKKLLRWGSLIPKNENRIVIKGSFQTLTGIKTKAKQKNRGLEIHLYLYT